MMTDNYALLSRTLHTLYKRRLLSLVTARACLRDGVSRAPPRAPLLVEPPRAGEVPGALVRRRELAHRLDGDRVVFPERLLGDLKGITQEVDRGRGRDTGAFRLAATAGARTRELPLAVAVAAVADAEPAREYRITRVICLKESH